MSSTEDACLYILRIITKNIRKESTARQFLKESAYFTPYEIDMLIDTLIKDKHIDLEPTKKENEIETI